MKLVLKDILKEKGISVYALSKGIGVTYKSVWKMANGHTTSIKFDIIEKICLFLGVGVNEIFAFTEK